MKLGGTIPMELQPYAEDGTESCYTNLKPDMVIVDRRTNDVHIFVVSIADDSDLAEVHKNVTEQYQELIELVFLKLKVSYLMLNFDIFNQTQTVTL
jgi:hypothetical protein